MRKSTRVAVPVTSQAVGNQLRSLVLNHNMVSCDGNEDFKVGNIALFWLNLYSGYPLQYTSLAYDSTLEHIPVHEYGSANTLAKALDTRI